jgi:hypothetical protein
MKVGSMVIFALFCAALAATPVKAQDDGQQACMNDAMTICGQFIPDRERVAGCLQSNRQRVSMPCRMALARWH